MVTANIMPEISDSSHRMRARLTFDDDDRLIYYVGEVLKGFVEFDNTLPLPCTVVNVNFTGEANVLWSELELKISNGVQRKDMVDHEGKETYFNTTICVFGGIGTVTLPPGYHKIPFQFQIPHTAPSSFLGEIGSVSYKVTAYIEFLDPVRKRLNQIEQPLEVVAPLAVDTPNHAQPPMNLEFEESYSSCCSSPSPMRVRIHIPAFNFCPGQAISISISAENESNVDVKKITIELVKKERYHSTKPKSDYILPQVLKAVETVPIPANTNRQITSKLTVPSLVIPNLQNCNLIHVSIKMSGVNKDLEDENEICLTTGSNSQYNNGFNQPYPSSSSAYPGENTPNSGANLPPYTVANPSYPGANPRDPGANPRYPGANPTYPGANPPYPGTNPLYPGANPSYPGVNPPYPKTNPPHSSGVHPSHQPALRFQPPYQIDNAPSAPPSYFL
ncbi:hypothetical protein O0L34_g15289 [Tuta absoluta]|nr:hypothetical protein O0L34_g15289 [Tuta absoluta]